MSKMNGCIPTRQLGRLQKTHHTKLPHLLVFPVVWFFLNLSFFTSHRYHYDHHPFRHIAASGCPRQLLLLLLHSVPTLLVQVSRPFHVLSVFIFVTTPFAY